MTDTTPRRAGTCARCGKPTVRGRDSGGKYRYSGLCRSCRGWAESLDALIRTAGDDAELIRQVDVDKRSMADIARATGVSRQAVAIRLGKARDRQRRREATTG